MGRGIKPKVFDKLPDDQRYIAHIAGGLNPGYIYFLVCDDVKLVKIGASNRWDGYILAVNARITEVKNDVPFFNITKEYITLASPLGMGESEIHDHFANYHVA